MRSSSVIRRGGGVLRSGRRFFIIVLRNEALAAMKMAADLNLLGGFVSIFVVVAVFGLTFDDDGVFESLGDLDDMVVYTSSKNVGEAKCYETASSNTVNLLFRNITPVQLSDNTLDFSNLSMAGYRD